MKTAIYIEQGITQLVLTPDNEWEQNVIRSITAGTKDFELRRGSFYETRGGWVRLGERETDDSLIIVAGVKASENIMS